MIRSRSISAIKMRPPPSRFGAGCGPNLGTSSGYVFWNTLNTLPDGVGRVMSHDAPGLQRSSWKTVHRKSSIRCSSCTAQLTTFSISTQRTKTEDLVRIDEDREIYHRCSATNFDFLTLNSSHAEMLMDRPVPTSYDLNGDWLRVCLI